MDEEQQRARTLNFPVFAEFSVPLSKANGNCRTIDEFHKEETLKEDITDLVLTYKDLKKNELVTVVEHKKIKELDEELKDLLRELKILRMLNHRHCHKFLDVAVKREDLTITYIVFEPLVRYMSEIIEDDVEILFEEFMIKDVMRQLFKALYYLQEKSIMHRNVHPGNIAFNSSGMLKITNFREARRILDSDKTILSPEFRYQAPELLMTTKICGPPVDIWSAACIFAQLLLHRRLFEENDRDSVLGRIFGIFGIPTKRIWPDFFNLPECNALVFDTQKNVYNRLEIQFDHYGRSQPESTMKLLQCMFLYDPKRRYTAKDCLKHPFFVEESEGSDENDI